MFLKVTFNNTRNHQKVNALIISVLIPATPIQKQGLNEPCFIFAWSYVCPPLEKIRLAANFGK